MRINTCVMGRGLQIEQLLIIFLAWPYGFSIPGVGSQHCYATEHAVPLESQRKPVYQLVHYHKSWGPEDKNVFKYV